jgi:hypothetical protein
MRGLSLGAFTVSRSAESLLNTSKACGFFALDGDYGRQAEDKL